MRRKITPTPVKDIFMRRKITPTPTPVTVKDPHEIDCFICGRGGTHLVYIGQDQWRHDYCSPGSPNWKDWYDSHPEKHTDAGNILRGY